MNDKRTRVRLGGAERYRFACTVVRTAGTWKDKQTALIAVGWSQELCTEGRIKACLRDWSNLEKKWSTVKPTRVTRSGKRPPAKPGIGRMAVFDIETTDLTAVGRQGFLVCCSILPIDTDAMYTLSLRFGENYGSDQRLVEDVLSELARYDFLIGHNITGFDLNWLNTRRVFLGLPTMRRWYVFDTYQVARTLALRVARKSLAFLCDAFGIPCVKTSIYPAAWNDIRSPVEREFRGALDDIVYHCQEDVQANRLLFERLWPMSFGLSTPPLKLYKAGNAPRYALLE